MFELINKEDVISEECLEDKHGSEESKEEQNDRYLKCPNKDCVSWVEINKIGEQERCICNICNYNFCSLCKQLYHGISNNSDKIIKDDTVKLSSEGMNNIIDDRLTCKGAASISLRWNSWKESFNELHLTSRMKQTKHHIAVPPPVENDLSRAISLDYRIQCQLCNNDIIGPRFSCIHCPNGFECCINCSKDSNNLAKHHNLDHVFQIYLEDENPFFDPSYTEKCSICLSDDKEDMIKIDSCLHSAHLGFLSIYLYLSIYLSIY